MLNWKWATGTDQLLVGKRFVGVFSELAMPRAALVEDALASIVSAGPHTRLGLDPQPRKRLWRWGYEVPPVIELPVEIANASDADILQYVRGRPGVRRPLEVHVSERHLVVDFDHGLGDGKFAVELVATVFALCKGESASWVDKANATLALPRSILTTFGRRPSRIPSVLRAAGMLNRSALDYSAFHELVDWRPSPAVSIASIGPDANAAVDQWRRSRRNKVSSAVTWMFITRSAMLAAGLDLTEQVMFAFDCRRYLSGSQTVNGNFSIALQLRVERGNTIDIFSGRLEQVLGSGLPLVGQAAVAARAMVQARTLSAVASRCVASAPADIMYTDLGRITALDAAPWVNGERRSAVGILDPSGPNGITILNTRIAGARRVAFSFHDNVFDSDVLDRVTARMSADPVLLLDEIDS